MNATLAKDTSAILKRGGFWVFAEYDSTKDISDNMVAFLASNVSSGTVTVVLSSGNGIQSSGSATIGSETFSYSKTGVTLTASASLTNNHSKGELVIIRNTDGYSTFACLGHTAQTTFNAGRPTETNITNELEQNVGALPDGVAEPTFTTTLLQTGIDDMILVMGRDVEASTEEGATVINNTPLTDFAAMYITERISTVGSTYRMVGKFPHIKISGSSDLVFGVDRTTYDATFKILNDETFDNDVQWLKV